MPVTDQLLENNEKYAADFDGPLSPSRRPASSPSSPAWTPGSTSTGSWVSRRARPT